MQTDVLKTRALDHKSLALYGGQPIRARYLPYGHQEITAEDIEAVVRVLRSDWITTGPAVAAFEEAFAGSVGARYAVTFSSGTAALHAAVFAAGVGPGDEGITAPLTFCATANCLLYQGGTPVFADVEPDTLTLSPAEVARRITPRTKVILPMDYGGHPADLQALLDLADHHGLTVIEDACHALGATVAGRRVGSLSHLTVFSFHPVKHITTGEGGMVTTDRPEFARRLRLFRNHGIEYSPQHQEINGPWYYEMIALGQNYRLTDMGCALGLSQLQRLEANVVRRQAIAQRYSEAFAQTPGVVLPSVRSGVRHAWHLYPLRLELERLRADRAEIFRALRAENIGVNVHYIPVHLHPYYRQHFGYRGGAFPIAEHAAARLITLPLFHGMSAQDRDDVIEAVTKVLSHYAAP